MFLSTGRDVGEAFARAAQQGFEDLLKQVKQIHQHAQSESKEAARKGLQQLSTASVPPFPRGVRLPRGRP